MLQPWTWYPDPHYSGEDNTNNKEPLSKQVDYRGRDAPVGDSCSGGLAPHIVLQRQAAFSQEGCKESLRTVLSAPALEKPCLAGTGLDLRKPLQAAAAACGRLCIGKCESFCKDLQRVVACSKTGRGCYSDQPCLPLFVHRRWPFFVVLIMHE